MVFAGKTQWKQVGKCQKFEKHSTWEMVETIFWKISQNPQILKSRVSVLDFMSRSRKLRSRLHHHYLLLPMQKQKHNWNWSATYFILRIRFNKTSLFRMVLKRLKLHQITSIFRWCGTKFFLHTNMQNYTIWQHCSTYVYGSAYFWGCKKCLPKFDLAFPK